MTTASASIFEIHPLVESLCRNFTLHDLTCCIVVSSTWNINFSPFLWRRIRLYSESNYARFNTPLALAAAVRHCGLVQIIETNISRLLDLFDDAYSFHNLSTLRISYFGPSAGAFVQLVGHSTNLQTLELLSYLTNKSPSLNSFLQSFGVTLASENSSSVAWVQHQGQWSAGSCSAAGTWKKSTLACIPIRRSNLYRH